MPRNVELKILLRPFQRTAYDRPHRFQVEVWHRRSGKSYKARAKMLARALSSPRKDHRGFLIAPTYRQAKLIHWDPLKTVGLRIPGASVNEAELRLDLPNGSRMQLLGAENADTLRGAYADDVTFDETQLIFSEAWTKVVRPMLVDRQGTATFIGTPMGKLNLLHDLWQEAAGDPDWHRELLRHTDTNVIPESEIAALRRGMSEAAFNQEFLCSFDSAMEGSYYGRLLTQADEEGRITTVRHTPSLPVIGALDLGFSDLMVAVFSQDAGTEHRVIGARAYSQTVLPDVIRDWQTLGHPVDQLILPHDALVHDLSGTGKTRQRVIEDLGVRTMLAPRMGLHEGIEHTKLWMQNAWWDREATLMLREMLGLYRSEVSNKGIIQLTPRHDESSHWADAVRYLATGRREMRASKPLRRPSWAA